jgi:hypothetical protein
MNWKPTAAGDTVHGQYVRLEIGRSKSGVSCPIVVLQDSDGNEHGVWLWRDILCAGFVRQRPKIGDTVTVTYLGTKTSATGREYHDYVIERAARKSSAVADKPSNSEARRALEANKSAINGSRYGVPSARRLEQFDRGKSTRTWS